MGNAMRVIVIGGGGAGLVTAWLASSVAEVTLLEAEDRLGGHMRTVPVETPRGTVYAEMGFKHFFEPTYPLFRTVHRLLGLTTSSSRPSITVSTEDGRQIVAPPANLNQIWGWLSQPKLALSLWDYYRFIFYSKEASADPSGQSLKQAALSSGMNADHVENFFLPVIAANWGSPLADIADNPWWEVQRVLIGAKKPVLHLPQGLAGYVSTLCAAMPAVRVHCSSPARSIQRAGAEWRVETSSGVHLADHVVIATEAPAALELMRAVPEAASLAEAVARVETFHTTIAVHRDPKWMPASRANWSAINVFLDRQHPWQTEWSGRELNQDVFRSWVMPGREPPPEPIALHHFRHVIFRSDLLEVQKRIQGANGADGLWLAGMYTTGADYHESAVRSAVLVASRLAPTSRHLAELEAAAPAGAWPFPQNGA